MLVAQFALGIPITFGLVYVLIPLYGKASQTYRAIIAGTLPLVTAIPKVVVRLEAQRIDFLHPGDSHVLLNVLFRALHRFSRYASGPVRNQTFYSPQLRAWCNKLAGKVDNPYSRLCLVLYLQEAQKRREGNHFESKSISFAKEHALCRRYEHSDDPWRINVIDSSGRFLPDLQVHIQRSKGVVRYNRIFRSRLHCY